VVADALKDTGPLPVMAEVTAGVQVASTLALDPGWLFQVIPPAPVSIQVVLSTFATPCTPGVEAESGMSFSVAPSTTPLFAGTLKRRKDSRLKPAPLFLMISEVAVPKFEFTLAAAS